MWVRLEYDHRANAMLIAMLSIAFVYNHDVGLVDLLQG